MICESLLAKVKRMLGFLDEYVQSCLSYKPFFAVTCKLSYRRNSFRFYYIILLEAVNYGYTYIRCRD